MLSTPSTRNKGHFTRAGIDIFHHPWRSLTRALGFRIFYKVRLYLDGIPEHAWRPTIVERVMEHKCVLQYIVTDLVQPADTCHIELWAWTADPREIPRKVWLAFTHGPLGTSMEVYTSLGPPPEAWHQGNRYEVFIHMPLLEDYTAAACNLQEVVDNPANFTPVILRYDWHYGLIDSSPPEAKLRYPICLPKPPKQPTNHDNSRRGARDGSDGRRTELCPDVKDGGRDPAPRSATFERRQQQNDARERERDRAHAKGRHSCNNVPFSWPPRRGDEDDNSGDYDHSGHGRKYDDSY
jgi:hypothetical protein